MRGWSGLGFVRNLGVSLLAPVAVGCGDCEFEANQIERFLAAPNSQVCSTDADCVVEAVPNCLAIESAFCGQLTLNRQASQSAQWQKLKTEAADCSVGVDSCEQCGALRIAKCSDRACSR